jgi:hypothetical protein
MDHLIRNLLKRTRRTVPEHQTKATFAQKVLVSLLIVGNISLASLIWVRSHAEQDLTVTKAIPSALLLDDHLIQSKLFDLAAKSSSRRAVMVMLVSASTSCATGRVIDILNSHAKRSDNNLLVLLPSTYSQTDIENFTVNLEVAYPVERADHNLSDRWLELAAKYNVSGVVLLIDKGEVSVLQNLTEVDRRLSNTD